MLSAALELLARKFSFVTVFVSSIPLRILSYRNRMLRIVVFARYTFVGQLKQDSQ